MSKRLSALAAAAAMLALLLAAATSAAAGKEEPPALIALKQDIVVHQDTVTLGDIFSGLERHADKPVGRAPEAGHPVELSARWLAALARTYGVEWQPSSHLDTTTVKRAAFRLESDELASLVERELAARGETARVDLTMETPAAALTLPLVQGAEAAVIGLTWDTRAKRFSGTLVYPNEGSPVARVSVAGRVYELVDVPVLTSKVLRGETIGPGDIDWQEMRIDRIPSDVVLAMEDVVGKAARRTLRAGSAVGSSELTKPVLVERNSKVTLHLTTPALSLATSGRAMEDGTEGDTIRVMNTRSNTVVEGVVGTDGSVRVASSDAPVVN